MLLLLEPALKFARHWRDWGNNILIAFLVIELLVEVWPELPSDWSPWNPPTRYTLWCDLHDSWKKFITVIAAFGVLIGVSVETYWSIRIDNIVDDMRIAQAPRPEVLYGDRGQQLITSLKPWAGQHIEVRICDIYFSDNDSMQTAMRLGSILSNAGWVGKSGYQIGAIGSGWIPPRRTQCGPGEGLWVERSVRAPKDTGLAAAGLIEALKGANLGVNKTVADLSAGELEPLDSSSVVLTVFAHPL
jgi:hypothetical protein